MSAYRVREAIDLPEEAIRHSTSRRTSGSRDLVRDRSVEPFRLARDPSAAEIALDRNTDLEGSRWSGGERGDLVRLVPNLPIRCLEDHDHALVVARIRVAVPSVAKGNGRLRGIRRCDAVSLVPGMDRHIGEHVVRDRVLRRIGWGTELDPARLGRVS